MKKDKERISFDIFSDLLLNDKRTPTGIDAATNRQFNLYNFPKLEACSNNKDKISYTSANLVKDLAYFFTYLPMSEVNRIVRSVVWLLKEGIKNYGVISIPEFGRFIVYDRASKCRYNLSTGERYKVNRLKLNRKINFVPSSHLLACVTPRDSIHMGIDGVTHREAEVPRMFRSFVLEKKHIKQGRVLMQIVFDQQFRYLGYSDEYIMSIAAREIKDESNG